MNNTHWSRSLVRIQACDEAVAWCAAQPSRQKAWATCERPDWLLFALDKSGTVTSTEWRLLACRFARQALEFAGDLREVCERTIYVAEQHARGESTDAELSAAESAAWNAARSAAWSAARSAAESARSAAESVQCKIIRGYFPTHRLPAHGAQ